MTDTARSYHSFVFDEQQRRFVGRFEDMYRAESTEGFDSWHQDDVANLTKRIALELVANRPRLRVLDIGCGKGAFTALLGGTSGAVVGIDISRTAVAVARERNPKARFIEADVAAAGFDLKSVAGADFDLVVCLETLSYIEPWRLFLTQMAAAGRSALVGLYLPENPIGFVKSFDELIEAFSASFIVAEDVRLESRRQILLLGESRCFS
jgi:SAM-dependent methyltransferase